jgi:hypothetical protein
LGITETWNRQRADGIEVTVLNPKVANRFAHLFGVQGPMRETSEVLREYSRRMPFIPWVAPICSSIHLRSLVRYIEDLSSQVQNQSRLHATQGSAAAPSW